MKATGILRKVDELGRIVIPIELRRIMGIDIKDPLEIFIEKDQIILKLYRPFCLICGERDNLVVVKGKQICTDCVRIANISS